MNVLVFKDKDLLQRLENPDRILRSTVNTVISTRLVPVGHYQALLYQGNSPIELN